MQGPYSLPPAAWQPPPSPRRGTPVWIWVLGVAMLLGLGACGAFAGCLYLGSKGDDGGVHIGAQISNEKESQLVTRGLLHGDERLVAYYDATIRLDMSDVALVTTERLVRSKDGKTTIIALADVTNIDHRDEGVVGDVIEVASSQGDHVRIEVAPLNGGISLLNALEDETRRKQPNVSVHRATAR